MIVVCFLKNNFLVLSFVNVNKEKSEGVFYKYSIYFY